MTGSLLAQIPRDLLCECFADFEPKQLVFQGVLEINVFLNLKLLPLLKAETLLVVLVHDEFQRRPAQIDGADKVVGDDHVVLIAASPVVPEAGDGVVAGVFEQKRLRWFDGFGAFHGAS
jgi:hypothetical protein